MMLIQLKLPNKFDNFQAPPSQVEEKFKKIVKQREGRTAFLEVLIQLPDKTKKWVNILLTYMPKFLTFI